MLFFPFFSQNICHNRTFQNLANARNVSAQKRKLGVFPGRPIGKGVKFGRFHVFVLQSRGHRAQTMGVVLADCINFAQAVRTYAVKRHASFARGPLDTVPKRLPGDMLVRVARRGEKPNRRAFAPAALSRDCLPSQARFPFLPCFLGAKV